MDWLWLTQNINGSGSNQRGKYKSAYHRATSPTWKSPPCGST